MAPVDSRWSLMRANSETITRMYLQRGVNSIPNSDSTA